MRDAVSAGMLLGQVILEPVSFPFACHLHHTPANVQIINFVDLVIILVCTKLISQTSAHTSLSRLGEVTSKTSDVGCGTGADILLSYHFF